MRLVPGPAAAAAVALAAVVEEEEELAAKRAFPMGRMVPFTLPVTKPPLMLAEEMAPSVLWSSEISMNEDCTHARMIS